VPNRVLSSTFSAKGNESFWLSFRIAEEPQCAGIVSECATTRPESSDPLRSHERRNPDCHMYELSVTDANLTLIANPIVVQLLSTLCGE
jgi:hypothetical protein